MRGLRTTTTGTELCTQVRQQVVKVGRGLEARLEKPVLLMVHSH